MNALSRAAFPAACVLAAACLSWQGPAASATAGPAAPRGPGAPLAAPVKWSPELGPVPAAKTNTAPALANVSQGKNRSNLLLFWTGPSDPSGFEISYQRSISLRKDTWSPPAQVLFGKARTRSRPAAAPIGTQSSGQLIVVWKDAANSRLLYSTGQEDKGGVVRWQGVQSVPGAAASAGPSVLQPLHSNIIVVTWKAASTGAVDYIVGFPGPSGAVRWGRVLAVPDATTAGTPAIAEASTSSQNGDVYVLWRVPGSTGRIDFAVALEPSRGIAKWSAPRVLPSSVRTGAPPSAQAIGQGSTFPLLVVFRARHGSALSYVTLGRDGKATSPLSVPHIRAFNGTGISPGLLAAQSPDPGQVFYEPFVRACAGC